jgi:phospholipid/cholesterol/gamma-HCH transport system substrate-binding protein
LARAKSNTDLKVGITVLTGIVILLIGIGWAKGWHFGGTPHLLHARFASAGGVEAGDPVFIHGIEHGKVTAINSPPGKAVDITMDLDIPEPLHKDASAQIMMLELMSGKKVEIDPGTTGTFDPAKDTIGGSFSGDISTLVASLIGIANSFPALTHNVDSVLAVVNDFFGGGEFKKKTYGALDEAEHTLQSLQSVLAENRGALKRTIDQTDQLTRQLNTTITPGAEALLDSTRIFVRRAGRTLSGADTLLASLNEILADSKNKKSFLYKLTSDAEFANRLDSLLISGHKLVEQLRLQGLDANIRFFNSSKPEK